jgi:hypothetical protein
MALGPGIMKYTREWGDLSSLKWVICGGIREYPYFPPEGADGRAPGEVADTGLGPDVWCGLSEDGSSDADRCQFMAWASGALSRILFAFFQKQKRPCRAVGGNARAMTIGRAGAEGTHQAAHNGYYSTNVRVCQVPN